MKISETTPIATIPYSKKEKAKLEDLGTILLQRQGFDGHD